MIDNKDASRFNYTNGTRVDRSRTEMPKARLPARRSALS